MNRPGFVGALLLGLSNLASAASTQDDGQAPEVGFVVKAGSHKRSLTPIRFEVAAERFGTAIRKAVEAGPVALSLHHEPTTRGKIGPSNGLADAIAQVEKIAETTSFRVTCILDDTIPSGGSRHYSLGNIQPDTAKTWGFDESQAGRFDLKQGNRLVFRYNQAPVSSPNYGPIQVRDAYIHPAYSPSGALITGDFSPSHPHHRGFFLAYEKTKWGNLTPDFWNIHYGTGKIHADGPVKPIIGPLTARFSARHRWEAIDRATGKGTIVLRENWEVEAYAISNSPYWLFDLTSTQQAVDQPLEVLPYRYGGMAYRGPEPFVKGTLDVLTSEGKHRKDGDQKAARWVDLTGPIADGSDQYAGALIADHPSNPHYPNVVRIHPTTLPFFSYVPAYDKPVTIGVEASTVFRYRVLIHDGHPNPMLDDQVAQDFTEPPIVIVD